MGTITLAGKQYDVPPLPFGKLRKVIASFNRMRGHGQDSDSALEETSVIFGLLIGKEPDEIDCMEITFQEMTAGIEMVPELCGLVERVPESGEAQAVADGMKSTAT